MAISASPAMPRPYSDDLRCKLLQVYERSALGLEELAEQFGVSYGYSKKIRRQQLHSGQGERGSASAAARRLAATARPDLGGIGRATAAQPGPAIEQDALVRSAAPAGVAAKKNRFTRPSRTARKPGRGGTPGAKP